MLQAKFTNNKTLPYLQAIETEEYYNGASRRSLSFECEKDAMGLDVLNNLLSTEANVQSIKLTNSDTDTENIYTGYVLKAEIGIKNRLIAPETESAPAQYADRLCFKLCKRTYIEDQLARLGL